MDTSRLLNSPNVIVKIRYRKQANYCTVGITAENLLHVQLHELLESIASGQAAAFYDEVGLLLGGLVQHEAVTILECLGREGNPETGKADLSGLCRPHLAEYVAAV